MEKKTKHRILGALVVIALVIIFLPLFQSGKDISPEKVVVKAPPFPDQTTQVPTIPVLAEETAAPKPSDPISKNAQSENQTNAEDLMSINRPSVVSSSIPNKNKSDSETPLMKPTIKKTPHITKEDSNLKVQTVSTTKIKSNKNAFKLKDASWVIQIGSFKNKTNALRLVNQLRAKGYRAFIEQKATRFGANTRVFVGPENKHTSARALASQLENEMHIRGIIISYKPLTL